jgi:hypothetical protein
VEEIQDTIDNTSEETEDTQFSCAIFLVGFLRFGEQADR